MSATDDLRGWGTALTGALVDKNGQTFGGGKDINSFLADIQKYDPNAKLVDQTNSEGGYSGSILNYDISKLPQGATQAMTGPTGGVEISDPNSHWGDNKDTTFINPNAIASDPTFGSHTSMNNIHTNYSGFEQAVDKYGPMVAGALIAGGTMMGIGGLAGIGAGADATGSLASEGTGAFDMAGSAGTGIPGSEGLGAASSGSWASNIGNNIADRLNPSNIVSNFTHNISSPSWWLQQAGKQGLSYAQRQAQANALRQYQQQMQQQQMGG